MKKYWYIIMMTLCCTLVATSCSKDDDEVVDEVWKQQNIDAFDAIAKNPEYTELKSLGNNGSIYYKVLKKGEGTKPIYYNSKVRMYYTGTLINGTVFDTHEYPYQEPVVYTVNNLVGGWVTALQEMHVGDRWEVWIPYTLAYGTTAQKDKVTGKVTIPAYSTLHFEMEVVEIVEE